MHSGNTGDKREARAVCRLLISPLRSSFPFSSADNHLVTDVTNPENFEGKAPAVDFSHTASELLQAIGRLLMVTLVIDIGGRNVKVWMGSQDDKFKFPSGPDMTATECVRQVRRRVKEFKFDRVSIGYPGDVLHGEPSQEPVNLGGKWVGFRFEDAFECPVRIMNDACLQALGSYEGGRMLYLGFGTGVGSVYMIDGKVVPLAFGHLAILRGGTLHDHLSREGLERRGKRKWQRSVSEAVPILKEAFQADYVVLGGGNAKLIDPIPEGARRGGNRFAFLGGLRLWEDEATVDRAATAAASPASAAPGTGTPLIALSRRSS